MSIQEYTLIRAHIPDNVHERLVMLADASGLRREHLYARALAHAAHCDSFYDHLRLHNAVVSARTHEKKGEL